MKRISADELLWELSQSVDVAGRRRLGRDRLEAYALGQLPASERALMEQALAHDPVGRSQVSDILGLKPLPVVEEVRKRLFDQETAAAPPTESPRAWQPFTGQIAWARTAWVRTAAIAAVVLLVASLVIFKAGQPTTFEPSSVGFDVALIGGHATSRGQDQQEGLSKQFFPHSRLRIEVQPQFGPPAAVAPALALYRVEGNSLVRLNSDSSLHMETFGETTILEAPEIGALVGHHAGPRALFVVAGKKLPQRIEFSDADPPERALENQSLWFKALQVDIVKP